MSISNQGVNLLRKTGVNFSVFSKSGILYDYKVQKISTLRYEWEYCEGVWERYEDSNWQIFVDYGAMTVFVNKVLEDINISGRRNTIKLADSVWDLFEEVQITSEQISKMKTDTAKKVQFSDPNCQFVFEEKNLEMSINGDEELRIIQNCLLERLNLTNEEKQGKLNEFIYLSGKKIELNPRLQSFELIENI